MTELASRLKMANRQTAYLLQWFIDKILFQFMTCISDKTLLNALFFSNFQEDTSYNRASILKMEKKLYIVV